MRFLWDWEGIVAWVVYYGRGCECVLGLGCSWFCLGGESCCWGCCGYGAVIFSCVPPSLTKTYIQISQCEYSYPQQPTQNCCSPSRTTPTLTCTSAPQLHSTTFNSPSSGSNPNTSSRPTPTNSTKSICRTSQSPTSSTC
jgi:hypothetical protein